MQTRLNYQSSLAIIACLLWSSAFVGIKIGLQYTTPLQFAGIRFILSGLLILPFCGNFFQLLLFAKNNMSIILYVTFFQTTLLYTLFYSGIQLLPASVAAMIIGSQPLIIAVIAHFWSGDDRMTIRKTFCIFMGIAGVLLISVTRGQVSINSGIELIGIMLLLGSNISAGLGNMIVHKIKENIPYLTLNCIQLFLGGFFLLLISLPVEGFTWQAKEPAYYYSLAWLSFISAAALSIWFHLLRTKILVSDINIWKFLIPVSGACISWIILDSESPEPYSVTGMVLIVFALILLNLKSR